jgi:phage FluMu protein Com
MLTIRCEKCQIVLQVKEELLGKPIRCPKCQQVTVVNAAPPAPPVAPPAAPPRPVPRVPPPPSASPAPKMRPTTPRDEEELPFVAPTEDAREGGAPIPQVASSPKTYPGQKVFEDLPKHPLPNDCPREARSLGDPIAAFDARGPGLLGWIAAGGLVAIALAFFIGSANMFMAKITNAKERANNDIGKWIVFSFGFVFLAGGGATGVLVFLSPADARLWMCPRGLVWKRKERMGWCRWEEITTFQRVSVRINYARGGIGEQNRFIFKVPDGEKFDFEGHGDSDARFFGERMQQYVTVAVAPVFEAKFRRGELLDFGPVQMDLDEISFRNVGFPWKKLGSLEMKLGVFSLYDRNDRRVVAAIAVGDVSHALLFHMLATQHFQQLNRDRAARK